MARVADTGPVNRPRVGRPPRISRQMIAEAAHELGLGGLTLKAVANHLGVSVAALYHHVSGKDDLLRLAAEVSARRVPLPADRGQHWAQWLLEWATYNREAFLAEPKLLAQYLEGVISAQAIAGNVDTILGLLVRQGFSITEANDAYELVTSCALGSAVATIREREAERTGTTTVSMHRQVLTDSRPEDLPYLRQLVATAGRKGARRPFRDSIATVLCGIAIRQGVPWEEVLARLDDR